MERWRVVVNTVGVTLFVVLLVLGVTRDSHKDFDLYYYGGVAERSGTYTDTRRVIALAEADDVEPTKEDVFGSATLVALVFQPLSLLPRGSAVFTWMGISGLALAIALRVASPRWWGAWLGAMAASSAMHIALRLGQASILISALLILSYAFLAQGRDRPAGMALGLATALKLFPVFLVIALISHRRTAGLAAAAATVVVLGMLTLPALGLHDTASAIDATAERTFVYPAVENQSAPGVVQRAFSSQSAAKVVSVVLTVLAAYSILRRRTGSPADTFALALLLMLAVQAITWEHYFLMAVVGLLAWALHRGWTRRDAIITGVAALLLLRTTAFGWLPDTGLGALANAPALFGTLLLAFRLASARRHLTA